jgi:HAAS
MEMTDFTPAAQESLSHYLAQVRLALQGCTTVDADEVEADVREHIEAEATTHTAPVDVKDLDAILLRLGPPEQWVPEEEYSGWQRFAMKWRTGPEDYRLAYMTFGSLILWVLFGSMSLLGFLALPILSMILARMTLAAAGSARALGVHRWMVYPSLLLVYIPASLILAYWPLMLGNTSYTLLHRFAGDSHTLTTVLWVQFGFLLGAMGGNWLAWKLILLKWSNLPSILFAPFVESDGTPWIRSVMRIGGMWFSLQSVILSITYREMQWQDLLVLPIVGLAVLIFHFCFVGDKNADIAQADTSWNAKRWSPSGVLFALHGSVACLFLLPQLITRLKYLRFVANRSHQWADRLAPPILCLSIIGLMFFSSARLAAMRAQRTGAHGMRIWLAKALLLCVYVPLAILLFSGPTCVLFIIPAWEHSLTNMTVVETWGIEESQQRAHRAKVAKTFHIYNMNAGVAPSLEEAVPEASLRPGMAEGAASQQIALSPAQVEWVRVWLAIQLVIWLGWFGFLRFFPKTLGHLFAPFLGKKSHLAIFPILGLGAGLLALALHHLNILAAILGIN